MPTQPDPAADPGLPELHLLQFAPTAQHAANFAARLEPTLADDWRERYCPLIGAAVDLLKLSDLALAERLALMRGLEGLALVGELMAEVEAVSGELRLFLQGFAILRARIGRGLKSAGLQLPEAAR